MAGKGRRKGKRKARQHEGLFVDAVVDRDGTCPSAYLSSGSTSIMEEYDN